MADVPVGAFLSGGLDSSVVVALMARQIGSRLKTFSIGFQESNWDESDQAAEVAQHFGTRHEMKIVRAHDLAADLPSILAGMDQPTGDGINTYLISQLARAGGVKVALSGLGADELFGGYPSFRQIPAITRWLRLWQRLPSVSRGMLVDQLRARHTGARKLADILEHGRNVHEVCALQRRVFGSAEVAELLHPEFRNVLHSVPWCHPSLSQFDDDPSQDDVDVRSLVSRWESETYMADVLLRDADVMSMRHSLELRVPFVDPPLINWLSRQRPEFRFDSARPKSALFDAVRDLLPSSLEHRRKRGFTLPFAQWMKRELRPFLEETFNDASVRRSGFFSAPATQALWRTYLRGSDTRQWSRVWSLAVLIHFANRHHSTTNAVPSGLCRGFGPDKAASFTAAAGSGCRSARTFLLLAPELFARDGGIARILRVYLRALVEISGPEDRVRFVSLNDTTVPQEYLQSFPSHKLDEWRVCGGDKGRFITDTLQLARECDHLLCGHVAQLPVALAAKTIAPALQYTLVAHGIEVWRGFNSAEQIALEQVERILCVSRHTAVEMRRRISLPQSRIAVLPNALDPNFPVTQPRPIRPSAGGGTILTISRLDRGDRYKGIDRLIEALPEIRRRRPSAQLRIIGQGNDTQRLEQLREQLSLGRAVTLLGSCTEEQVAAELAACDLFALPSTREGFGLVFLEAMAHGRPCVGVRAGAIPELVTPATGILVQPNNVSALAHACIDGIDRTWDHSAIIARAKEFSYPIFKERLASLVIANSRASHASPLVTHP